MAAVVVEAVVVVDADDSRSLTTSECYIKRGSKNFFLTCTNV